MPTTPPARPTEDAPFVARYNPWLGGALLGLGLLCLLLNIWILLLSGTFNGGVIVGAIVTVVGILYLTRPCFSVAPNRLSLYSPAGMVVKRYPFVALTDIQVEGNKLYIASPGAQSPSQREKVSIAKWMVNPTDWKTLTQITKK